MEATRVPHRLLRLPHFYFAIAFALTMAAFWPSFISKLGTTDLAHMIHGVSATLWMMVPIIQSWLISKRKFGLHRKLGISTLLIVAPVLVVSGLHMVQLMVREYEETHDLLLLKFAFLDIAAMALFVAFLVLALRSIRRGDVDAHSRYMAGTVLFALEPAMERIFVFYVPGVADFSTGLYLALGSMEFILAALIYFEWRRGRVRLPFCLALGFFVAIHLLLTPIATSPAFSRFALWYATI